MNEVNQHAAFCSLLFIFTVNRCAMKYLLPGSKTTCLLLFTCIATTAYCQYGSDDHLNTPDPNQPAFYNPDKKPHELLTGYTTNFNDLSNMQGSRGFHGRTAKGSGLF